MRGYEGSAGPLTPGLEERLTYADTNEDGEPFRALQPTWAVDGSGILYSFSPRPYLPGEKKLAQRCILSHPCRAVAADPKDRCLAMLPPSGGSAYWNVCESRSGHSTTTDIIQAGAINRTGQLLYTESSAQALASLPYDLWLATQGDPLNRRRLCSQVTEPSGVETICGVFDFTDIQWTGTNTFVAVTKSSITQGTITTDFVTLAAVPGTSGVAQYSLVDGARAAVFIVANRADHAVRRVKMADGTVTVVGTLPLGPGGEILDVGCHSDVCVVLASGGGTPGTWNLWKMDLATGHSAIVRTFDHPIATAKLSPVSGDVVALEGANIYLLTGVIP